MRLALVVPTLVLAGCIATGSNGSNSNVDLQPVEVAISSAASLGLVSSIAMNAIASSAATQPDGGGSTNVTVPCAQVTQACTTFPCSNGAVTITLGNACPFPIGGVASGSVSVTGNWTSATSATLSSTFTNVQVGTGASVVVSATDITASPTSFTYTGQNVVVHGAAVLAAQSNWTVTSNGDAGFTIDGTDQSVAGIDTTQINVSGVVLDPSCTKNPTAGNATLQSVSGLKITQATVDFHSACDGEGDINGSAVTLNFASP